MTWSGRHAQRMRALVLSEWGDICHLCGRPGADSADHLIPRSKGGPDTLANLRPAHMACNSRRGNRPVPRRIVVDGLTFFKQGGPGHPAPPEKFSPDPSPKPEPAPITTWLPERKR